MKKKFRFLKINKKMIMVFLLFALSSVAMATTSDAPWDKMLTKFLGYLTGSTARLLSILALAFAGYKIIWGNAMEGGSWLMKVVIGMSIIFAAASWGPLFFGYSGSILM
ncbi:MAG: TrbC/VirB2 family protein [Fusobacterium sp.]|uniref:TrbC/VirB2 family protein n=1 Tax=Fusobacterium sp. TaxID=68766 RepID=UPI0026DB4145|nr:TrbC/VirB2 family protein [Fusobacterium sp.]MDO4689826.1 TrbC/VirB2 family protein [Fusobacterium sp.]